MTAGNMRNRLMFQSPATDPDEFGNVETGWVDAFTVPAEIKPYRGGEEVMAARLTGVQPYIVKIRSSKAARSITPTWRIVDARDRSRVFNITTISDHDQKNAMLTLMAVQSAAT